MAQPKSTFTIQAVLEAVNLLGEGGMFWLGGQQSLQSGDNIIMSRNYPTNYPENYDEVNIVVSPIPKKYFHNFAAGMAAASSKWIHTVGFCKF